MLAVRMSDSGDRAEPDTKAEHSILVERETVLFILQLVSLLPHKPSESSDLGCMPGIVPLGSCLIWLADQLLNSQECSNNKKCKNVCVVT